MMSLELHHPQMLRRGIDAELVVMDAGGGSRHAGAPRTLDVQKFANARGAEVHALHAVLKEKHKGKGDGSEGAVAIPRCLRRRTTSHNRRKSFFWKRKQKKRKHGDVDEDEAIGGESARMETEGGDIAKKPPCRRVRRRIELKGDEQGGGGCCRDGTQRLVTHVWHAKRFSMTKIWGHWLAEGLPGRGRGSRAVIRWVREAAVLQDASFYSAIELEGCGKSITEALQLVLEPAPKSVVNNGNQAVYSGAGYGKAMLHHMGRCPRGAIAPVTFIWRPESKAGEERRIWLWVHAAAFEEALACLQHLCQTQGLQCWSRKGQLGRLDLLGSKAVSILQKVLYPVARQASQEGCVEAIPPSSSDSSSFIESLEESDQFPGGAVIGVEVCDPRGRSHSDMTFQPSVLVDASSVGMEVVGMDVGVSNSGCPSMDNQMDVKSSITDPMLQRNLQPLKLAEKLERQLVGNREMWDRLDIIGQGSVVRPSSEKDLSTWRHKERLSYIQLNDISEDAKEKPSAASESLKCPILILKHAHQRSSACGFSLILPVAWVRAFWVPLVFAGGRVIGLRERHWLNTDAKLPSFPHDYPDCSSYDQHMARKAAEDQEIYNRRPPSKRGIWNCGLPDWNFANEAPPLYPENRSTAQGVSRAEFGAEATCSAACENSETFSEKTSNDTIVCPSSTGPDAPSTQLNCSTIHHVLTTISGAGISAVTEAEVSMIDSSKPSNEALVSPFPCNLTAAEMIPRDARDDCTSAPTIPAPIEVLHEDLTSDRTVGLREVHPPQLDPVFDSQPLVSTIEGENTECDSITADVEASTSAHIVPTLQEVSGQIENPSTLQNESVRAAVGERKASEGGDVGKSSMFVARTRVTLEKVLKDCDLHHLPLLTGFRMSIEFPSLPIFPGRPILPGHRSRQLVGDGSTELAKKGCLVRVLIHAPRKGVFDAGAIIYLPLPSDVDSYLSSSQRWQGFDDPSFKQIQQSFLNKKKRKQRAKGERKTMSALHGSTEPQSTACKADIPGPESESCSFRIPIGIITSSSVRGSTSSAAIGICEVAALGVLRAKQMAPDGGFPNSEIFVLARNASSSMYRPALVMECEDG